MEREHTKQEQCNLFICAYCISARLAPTFFTFTVHIFTCTSSIHLRAPTLHYSTSLSLLLTLKTTSIANQLNSVIMYMYNQSSLV